MTTEIMKIINFMVEAFIHIWPYLVVTIPIAVAVNMSGASKYIKRTFDAGPITAIFLATIVGAFSPFCSCGVIPIIASLLISGVPLPPVMAFWVASPSMDPEIFFLSVGTIGWDLAVWWLVATFSLSLSSGFITHFMMKFNWISSDILKYKKDKRRGTLSSKIMPALKSIASGLRNGFSFTPKEMVPAASCCSTNVVGVVQLQPSVPPDMTDTTSNVTAVSISDLEPCDSALDSCKNNDIKSFWTRLFKESSKATIMVIKFMALAFFLEAIIILYVPSHWITGAMGIENSWAIISAALLGVPVYTSNLSALPMISGLLAQGMSPAAALTFLIAGPTTTLPAMAAVWSLVNQRVFFLYVSFSLIGAIVFGYLRFLVG